MKRPAVFFDRDNTLIVSDGYLGDPAKVELIAGASQAVARARKLGFAVVVFSNQSGVARGMFTEEDVQAVNARLDQLLRAEDPTAIIDRHEYCPFHPEGTIDVYARESDRRKPKPGMILSAARAMALDLSRSWVIGDAARDIEAGKAAGCRAILFHDPALKKSPAAERISRLDPDLVVSKLSEALDHIETHLEPTEPVPGNEAVAPSSAAEATAAASPAAATSPAPAEAAPGAAPSPATTAEATGMAAPMLGATTGASITPAAPSASLSGGEARSATTAATGSHNRATAQPGQGSRATATVPMAHATEPAALDAAAPATTPAPIREPAPEASARGAASTAPAHGRGAAPAAGSAAAPASTPASSPRSGSPATTTSAGAAPATPGPRQPKVVIGSKYVAPAGAVGAGSPRGDGGTDTARSAAVDPRGSDGGRGAATRDADGARSGVSSAGDRSSPQRKPWRDDDAAQPPEPAETGLKRLESLLEQIFLELRRRHEQHDGDFSVSKLLGGIVQILVLAVLLFAYLRRDAGIPTVQTHLLLALTLQAMTIALLIMSRQK